MSFYKPFAAFRHFYKREEKQIHIYIELDLWIFTKLIESYTRIIALNLSNSNYELSEFKNESNESVPSKFWI